jgi:hypothetical protein
LGEWWAIGYGIIGIFTSHFLLGIVMMPGLLFAAPAVLLANKGKTLLAFPLLFLGQLYTYVVIVIWCLLVFLVFMSRASFSSFWPLLIWSYGVALGPLMYMAQREQQSGSGDASTMTTFFAQIGYIVTALVAAFQRVSLLDLAIIFSGIMALGMLIQICFAVVIFREQKRLGIIP